MAARRWWCAAALQFPAALCINAARIHFNLGFFSDDHNEGFFIHRRRLLQ